MIISQQLDTNIYESIDAKFEIACLHDNNEQIAALRKEAHQIFKSLGFPTTKNEEWVHTSLVPFLKDNYSFEQQQIEASSDYRKNISSLVSEHINAIYKDAEKKDIYLIVNVNGQWNKELSILPNEEIMTVVAFEEAQHLNSFKTHFGKIATLKENAFSALNTALFPEGIFMEVPKNKKIDKPLHIVNIYQTNEDVWLQPRNLIVVNTGASLEVIETVISKKNDNVIFVNGLSEIAIAENAHFNHYDIQTGTSGMRFVQRIEASQKRNSNYSNYTFTLPGTDLVRNNLTLHLDDPDLDSHMYGLYLSADKQLVDNHTEVHHKHPHGESNQLYKGVLLDKSRAVFNGKIYVYPQAQKTNAFQQSSNILFSDQSTVNAKPQLEIFADDVKCSHGTTMGQLDKEALFYLQSRGISLESAKKMMVRAFAFDVTQKIDNEVVRAYVEKIVDKEMERTA